jgi:hypothetical protein
MKEQINRCREHVRLFRRFSSHVRLGRCNTKRREYFISEDMRIFFYTMQTLFYSLLYLNESIPFAIVGKHRDGAVAFKGILWTRCRWIKHENCYSRIVRELSDPLFDQRNINIQRRKVLSYNIFVCTDIYCISKMEVIYGFDNIR